MIVHDNIGINKYNTSKFCKSQNRISSPKVTSRQKTSVPMNAIVRSSSSGQTIYFMLIFIITSVYERSTLPKSNKTNQLLDNFFIYRYRIYIYIYIHNSFFNFLISISSALIFNIVVVIVVIVIIYILIYFKCSISI